MTPITKKQMSAARRSNNCKTVPILAEADMPAFIIEHGVEFDDANKKCSFVCNGEIEQVSPNVYKEDHLLMCRHLNVVVTFNKCK